MLYILPPRFVLKMSHVSPVPSVSLCAAPRPQSAFFFHCLNSHTSVRRGSEGGLVDPLSSSFRPRPSGRARRGFNSLRSKAPCHKFLHATTGEEQGGAGMSAISHLPTSSLDQIGILSKKVTYLLASQLFTNFLEIIPTDQPTRKHRVYSTGLSF